MTSLMDQAIEALRHVPGDRQDEFARVVMQFAAVEQPIYRLTPEERADIREAKHDIERGDFASVEDIREIRTKHSV